MLLELYRPKPTLVTKTTQIIHPRYPVIDMHNHLGAEFGGGWIERPLNELLDALDSAGVEKLIDLDGGWGENILTKHIDHLKTKIPDRFEVFGGVDWEKWVVYREEFPYWAAERLSFQASIGAQGLKIWKNFGLRVYDHLGNLVRVNDRRLDPIWNRARELNFPVMIHIADPVAFFEPLNEENERWEEMSDNPDWQFPEQKFPRFTNIIEDFANLIREHPKTMFIGAHVGCYAENLQWVSSLLNECPNFFVDISARIAELGRQPYAARRFFHDYSDRILFGSDLGPDIDSYRIMYRFLETDDEYFNYGTSEIPTQGRWNIYGIYLEDDFLRKIYRENAVKLLRATSETNNDELSKQL